MTCRTLPALGVLILAGAVAAAPPTATVAESKPVPKGNPSPAAKPRAAAFVTGLDPLAGPGFRLAPTPKVETRINDAFDLIVFAKHRPVKIRLTVAAEGKPITERWTGALKGAFAFFDRDGDGFLSGHEVRLVFSDSGLASLSQNGYYGPTPQDQPTLDRLDRDGDRRVSFDEFAAYYKLSAGFALKAQPPLNENTNNAQVTEALFKLLDRNGDNTLTRDEVAAVEALLPARDADEDECLSMAELVPNANVQFRGGVQPVQGGQPNGMATTPVGKLTVLYEAGRAPGTLTQRVVTEYDKDNDRELTPAESGFDDATFARLDTDRSGKLSGEELDAWRTDAADLDVSLLLAAKAVDCKADVTTDANLVAARGFVVRKTESGRVVVQVGRQNIELWSFAQVVPVRVVNLKQQYGPTFQFAAGAKGFVEERDLYGQNAAQLQLLRVAFDPADRTGDGKVTREEYDAYLDLQQSFLDLSLSLVPGVQTPSLFQLLDDSRDGRLGVRELRTAWDRLLALEPAGASVVTRNAIQPTVTLWLTRSLERYYVNQQVNVNALYGPNGVPAPTRGPLWFRKMDRNGDGDVSRLEFLGTKAEFEMMDADRDALVSVDEAEAYDKKVRAAEQK